MARIEGFRVSNFRVLKEVALGRLWNQQKTAPLTPMSAVSEYPPVRELADVYREEARQHEQCAAVIEVGK